MGGLFLLVFFSLQLVILPYIDARSRLENSVRSKQGELIDIQLLKNEYNELKSQQGDLEKRLAVRPDEFSLFSFLEEQAAAAQVKDYVSYMKPSSNVIEEGFSESIVEMKIERINLEQLVSFLNRVESDENIVLVQRISIQENPQEEGLLDSVISIKTFEVNRS